LFFGLPYLNDIHGPTLHFAIMRDSRTQGVRAEFLKRIFLLGGPGSVVGIATAYGLDGPGIESRWEQDFPHLSRPALRATEPPVQWVPGLSRG